MRSLFSIASFVLLALSAQAQLVNKSFENSNTWPTQLGQYLLVNGWSNAASATADPDYYHVLGTSAADLPETPFAIVEAYKGDAIMGFIATGEKFTNQREYINTKFTNPLVVGKKYHISFKITNGTKTAVSTSGLSTDNLGLLFTLDEATQVGTSPILMTPQLVHPGVVYSREWIQIEFDFVADQPYNYMTLGVFGTDDDKNITAAEPSTSLYAYYFVDDFFMSPVSTPDRPIEDPKEKNPPVIPGIDPNGLVEDFQVPNAFTPNNDGVNDVFFPVSDKIEVYTLSVFNRWGERVFYSEDPTLGWDGTFRGLPACSDTYAWEISYTIYEDSVGFVNKNQKGIVTMIR
ncbi:MAG: gliding motility-associated C-terminal domain-containing protein [Flavobacteriales bacterium]